MSDLEQLRNDIRVYDEEYEALHLQMKNHTSVALKLVRGIIDTEKLYNTVVELALCNQKLVEIRAMAAVIFRSASNFYYITKTTHKERLIKEKNIAEEVAESEALALSIEEFTVMDQAEYSMEVADKRWASTETMIHTLLAKLGYGKTTQNSANTSDVRTGDFTED